MKTTIDLPEDLLHRAKIVAAQRKTTLKQLVVQGLDHAIAQPGSDSADARRTSMEQLLSRMRASNTEPMVPLKREEVHDR